VGSRFSCWAVRLWRGFCWGITGMWGFKREVYFVGGFWGVWVSSGGLVWGGFRCSGEGWVYVGSGSRGGVKRGGVFFWRESGVVAGLGGLGLELREKIYWKEREGIRWGRGEEGKEVGGKDRGKSGVGEGVVWVGVRWWWGEGGNERGIVGDTGGGWEKIWEFDVGSG